MEIYHEGDERIIATTIPSFGSKRSTLRTQIRISETGDVVLREFRGSKFDIDKVTESRSTISTTEVSRLIKRVASLLEISGTMPVIDDSGSREIALHQADGTHHSVLFPDGAGRKHPAKKPFEDVWHAIEASAKPNSEQDAADQLPARDELKSE